MVCNTHIAHGISAPCCFLLRQRLFLICFPARDQLNQGLKTQGAGEESLQAQEEEIVVNAIDMEPGLHRDPKTRPGRLSWPNHGHGATKKNGPLRLQDRLAVLVGFVKGSSSLAW